ncbi:ABC transporter ATP-binding protein [Vagococcus entomophilus]|uniref:Bacitracin ABC transporter ATP-binding protein n=1 Tax=Vagococcus entomophilus TaxID=1160095 RepID=A0A430AIE1_9ENTE|nr:ABC transporter ATP-binding protein [Vagococcus entomophilus]RSU07773.1 bacitracin ABC transporter ATP-binding protein [Vagococcus entomophilus]
MLEIKNIKKVFGDKIQYEALKGIDLTVQDGEFIGIMGPSGSGKSTLLNLIATIDTPTAGTILLNQQDPNQLSQEKLAQFRRRELGFVFQDFNLMPTLTVEENIVLPLTLDGEKVSVMNQKMQQLAQRLGIESLLKKRIGEISGGQKQRVAVARAMIHQPQLLLADEPTGNLDTKSSDDVMHLLKQLNQEEHATILMVTHDPLAASFCQKIVFIKDGELLKEIQNPGSQQQFYDQLLGELRTIEGVTNEI